MRWPLSVYLGAIKVEVVVEVQMKRRLKLAKVKVGVTVTCLSEVLSEDAKF